MNNFIDRTANNQEQAPTIFIPVETRKQTQGQQRDMNTVAIAQISEGIKSFVGESAIRGTSVAPHYCSTSTVARGGQIDRTGDPSSFQVIVDMSVCLFVPNSSSNPAQALHQGTQDLFFFFWKALYSQSLFIYLFTTITGKSVK